MQKKFHFVYITTNLINGKQYVGDHSTNDLECWKTKNYLGSGYYFRKALIKEGKKQFKREILEFFSTKELAFNAQEKYIKQFNTLVPNGYNISPKGGYMAGVNGHSEETILKMSNSLKGRTSPNKGKTLTLEHKMNISKNSKKLIHSQKSKEQISKSMTGKHWTLSEKSKENISAGKKGKKFTEKQIEARKNIKKIKCPHCTIECIPQLYNRWHGDKCKNKKYEFIK